MYLVHKKHLINEEQFVLPEGEQFENYTSVQKVEKKSRKPKMSPFELAAIAEGYNCLNSSIEDELYISGTSELTKEKAL